MDVRTRVGSTELATPLLAASGTFGYGEELSQAIDLSALGAIVTKTVTLAPRVGNPPPRLAELPAGLLNSIGLQNEGVADFLDRKMPFLESLSPRCVVSIGGEKGKDFVVLAEKVAPSHAVDALELNISCPNVEMKAGCTRLFSQSPEQTARIVRQVRAVTQKPLWVKLSPNVTDMAEIASAAQEGGADALVIANSYFGMKVDIEGRKPALGGKVGGVSGPAIRAQTLYHLHCVVEQTSLPVVGVGGIETVEDVLEYLITGACAVQLGTINFRKPYAASEILEKLKRWGDVRGIEKVNDIVGTLSVEEAIPANSV